MKPLPLLAALALAGCVGAQVATESATLEPTPAVSPAPVVVEGAAPGSIPPPRAFPTIYMKGGFVTTPEVHALVGEQVVWRNEDLYAHEIVSDAGFFTAQVIEAGGWGATRSTRPTRTATSAASTPT